MRYPPTGVCLNGCPENRHSAAITTLIGDLSILVINLPYPISGLTSALSRIGKLRAIETTDNLLYRSLIWNNLSYNNYLKIYFKWYRLI